MVMLRQWNSRSELWVTILSMIRALGLSRIQRVRTSPSSSRSLAFVAVKTLAPIMRLHSSPGGGAPARPTAAAGIDAHLHVADVLTATHHWSKEISSGTPPSTTASPGGQ